MDELARQLMQHVEAFRTEVCEAEHSGAELALHASR